MRRRLRPRFYAAVPTEVARRLLGKYLIHDASDGRCVGRIVETEAYFGPEDRASHASRRNPAARLMFGPPGIAYVYLIYGVHHCLNVVAHEPGGVGAVLIRAVEPVEGQAAMQRRRSAARSERDLTNGPGKLCAAFHVTRRHNGFDLTQPPLYLEDRGECSGRIATSPRIGVDYAGQWAKKPWRFCLSDSPCLSRR